MSAPNHSLLPDEILSNIKVTQPLGMISVRGTVTRLSPFPAGSSAPKWIYGSIMGEDATIEFKCHPTSAPESVGANVIINGTLDTAASYYKTGLDVLISGNVTGKWKPENSTHYIHLDKENGRIYLLDFIRQHGIESLKIFTTQVGYNDFISAINKKISRHKVRLNYEVCKFYNAELLLKVAKTASDDKSIKAIAFIRGGKGDKTIEIWNNNNFVASLIKLGVPYYTAIGHTEPIYLAEKYSDEAFNNPNDFGNAISIAISRLITESHQKKMHDKQNEAINKLAKKVSDNEEYTSDLRESCSERINAITLNSEYRSKKIKKGLLFSITVNMALLYYLISPDNEQIVSTVKAFLHSLW